MIETAHFSCYREAPAAQFKHTCLEVTPPPVHGKAYRFILPLLSREPAGSSPETNAANELNENTIGVTSTTSPHPPCNEQVATVGHRNRYAQGDAAELLR